VNSATDQSVWQRIRLAGLNRLVNAPLPLRWRWETVVQDGRKKLLLRTPRGVRWQFRLQRGAWVRRLPPTAAGPL